MAKLTGEYIGKDATKSLLERLGRMETSYVDVRYDTMNEFLSAVNGAISVSEIMAMIGAEPIYSEPEYETIIALCGQMNQTELARSLLIADMLTTDWQRELKPKITRPTERIFELVLRRRHGHERATGVPEALARAWVDHHRSTKIPFAAMPEVCAFLKASPHWAMCLPDNVPYYCAGSPQIDMVLDRYSFIPEHDKPLFLDVLQDLSERRENE